MNRVILDDATKLVGVRLPIASLPTLRQHLTEAVQARKAVVDSGGGGGVEPVSPIDPKILLQVKTAPKNILSFFGRAPPGSPASASSASNSKPSTAAAAAAATPSPLGGKRLAGGGLGVGGSASLWPGSGSSADRGSVDGSGSSKKRRKGNGAAVGKRGKENNASSAAAKGIAALFGTRSSSGCGGDGGGSGGVGLVERKGEAPDVILIDDD